MQKIFLIFFSESKKQQPFFTFEITNDYDKVLRNKIERFREETKTKKALHLTMITTYGVKQGKYSGLIQSQVTMDDLFQ